MLVIQGPILRTKCKLEASLDEKAKRTLMLRDDHNHLPNPLERAQSIPLRPPTKRVSCRLLADGVLSSEPARIPPCRGRRA